MIDKRVRLLVTTIVRGCGEREFPRSFWLASIQKDPARPAIWERSHNQITNEGMQRRVLVVDDESLIADSVAAILSRNGYSAEAKYSGASTPCNRCRSDAPTSSSPT